MLIISSGTNNVENCTNLSSLTTFMELNGCIFSLSKNGSPSTRSSVCLKFIRSPMLLSELYHLYSAISTACKKTMRENLYICNSSLFNMNIFCFRTGIQLKEISFQKKKKNRFFVMLTKFRFNPKV